MQPRAYSRHRPHEAFAWADGWSPSLPVEMLPLAAAAGRALATELWLDHALPPQAQAATDGFALRAAETLGASDYSPLPLRLHAGVPDLVPGAAMLVRDGDPLPRGADAVVPLPLGEVQGELLEVNGSVAPGAGVDLAGAEGQAGERLCAAGRRLRPQDVARLALAGLTEVGVRCRPQVQILLAGRYAHDADGPMLANLVGRDGGRVGAIRPAADQASLSAALRQADAELILVAGATGYAPSDHAVAALRACGEVQLDGVAIHPGGGVVLGRVAATPAILLPGTPLACLCAYDLIAGRLLRRLAGRQTLMPYHRCNMPLARKLVSRIGRLELARVRIVGDSAEPVATAEGRVLASAVYADGFVLIPEQSEGYAAGTEVEVHRYDDYD